LEVYMQESYFLITCDEDGDIRVEQYSRAELLTALAEGDHGKLEFLDKLRDGDPMNWKNDGCILIKGAIVVPYAKETTVAFDVK